ncbi:MAG: hypothetical protein ACLR8U_15545 [Oscillospiraceae bacterium]
MDGEFTTYGTAEVMVANIAYEDAERMLDDLKEIKGVQSIDFDDTTDHYNNASALYSITFNYDETDDACLESLDKVKEYLSGQDIYVKTDLGNTQAETIEREINMIMVYVAIVIVAVLLFTSGDLRRDSGSDPDVRRWHDRQSGHELPAWQDFFRVEFRHEHFAAGAFHRLRHHLLQPL